MLIKGILDCGNSVSPLTAKTKKKISGLGLRCKKLRLPKRRDRVRAKEVSARNVIEAKTKKILAKSFKRPRPSKTKNRPHKW